MAIEVDPSYGGAGSSFFMSNIAIEEVAKVDMSVSLLVDIQNTLINSLLIKYGTYEQKEKYLPRLATTMVSVYIYSAFCTVTSFLF